jgi:hypothetical protein
MALVHLQSPTYPNTLALALTEMTNPACQLILLERLNLMMHKPYKEYDENMPPDQNFTNSTQKNENYHGMHHLIVIFD